MRKKTGHSKSLAFRLIKIGLIPIAVVEPTSMEDGLIQLSDSWYVLVRPCYYSLIYDHGGYGFCQLTESSMSDFVRKVKQIKSRITKENNTDVVLVAIKSELEKRRVQDMKQTFNLKYQKRRRALLKGEEDL